MAPPGSKPDPHHNQQATALEQAELTGGLRGSGKFDFMAFLVTLVLRLLVKQWSLLLCVSLWP